MRQIRGPLLLDRLGGTPKGLTGRTVCICRGQEVHRFVGSSRGDLLGQVLKLMPVPPPPTPKVLPQRKGPMANRRK